MNAPFQGWIMSLSNGNQLLEGTPAPGDKTSWQQAIDHIKRENLKPTALTLIWRGVRVQAQPKADGYFQGYDVSIPLFGERKERKLRGIGTVVGDKVFITWISDSGEIRQDVRALKDNLIHTTLRE